MEKIWEVTLSRAAAICAVRLILEANSHAALLTENKQGFLVFFNNMTHYRRKLEFKSLTGTDHLKLFNFSRLGEEMTCS